VAAGVMGLITAAVQASQSVTNIIQRTKMAPKECYDVRSEVDQIRAILTQLQAFVLGSSHASRSRSCLILVDQIVTTLSACVTTFSELDIFVEVLDTDAKMGLLDKLRWASKANTLMEMLQKLQMHESSLYLMLTILTWLVTGWIYQLIC
jgi:hypothetical protein